ncbi:T9SS type A sorting domain-containing protein [Soonwooa purpurea]
MKKIYCCLGLVLLSQVYGQKVAWQRDVKSSTQDFLSHITSTIDGQILIAGSSIQPNQQVSTGGSSSNKGFDYHLIKVDQEGQKLWEKYFSGNGHDYLESSIAAQDGSFLLTGTTYSTIGSEKGEKSFGGSDIWVIKLNENGEEQWQRTIGTRQNEEARTAVQTVDGNFVVLGSTNNTKLSFGQKDVLVVKLDKNGKILNQLILGGSALDEVEHSIATKDGGILLGIYSRSSKNETSPKSNISYKNFLKESRFNSVNIDSANTQDDKHKANKEDAASENFDISFYAKQSEHFGGGDYWLVKLDKDGKVEWEKTYGGKDDDHIKTLSLTDTGFLVGGESRSSNSGNKRTSLKEGTDLWMVALDEHGNEEWQKSYSFGNRDILMSANSIKNKESKTKGFLIGGYTQAEGKKKKEDETFWMLYIDNKGEEVWRKHIEGESKKNQERLTSAILTQEGSYILAGTSANQLGEENWKILKLKDSQIEDLMVSKNIQIYPNPVKDYCYVEIGTVFSEADLSIYDMTGRLVQLIKTKNRVTKINTSNLPQGTYIIKAQTNNQQNQEYSTKIIKE